MSVQSEITRISNNVSNTYTAVINAGFSVPATSNQTSANLASTVASALAYYDEPKLSGTTLIFNSATATLSASTLVIS